MRMVASNYKKAFVEVDAVLSCLNEDDYGKIPKEIINSIRENKDNMYNYEYNDKLNYDEWILMPESKAILYNIVKKYLATDEQKEYFKIKESYELESIEKTKKEKYNTDNIFKLNDNMKEIVVVNENTSFFEKIKNAIKKMLHKE